MSIKGKCPSKVSILRTQTQSELVIYKWSVFFKLAFYGAEKMYPITHILFSN